MASSRPTTQQLPQALLQGVVLFVLFLLLSVYATLTDTEARTDHQSRGTATVVRRSEPLSKGGSSSSPPPPPSSSSSSSSSSLSSPPCHNDDDEQAALIDGVAAAAESPHARTLPQRYLLRHDSNGNIRIRNRRHCHHHHDQHHTDQIMISHLHFLNMTLCHDQCGHDDCRSYITPISKCYNGGQLFPHNDPSWTHQDYFDVVICQTLVRTVFQQSQNGSCTPSKEPNHDDRFAIPLDECVGPFGSPRPWGRFVFVSHDA